MAKKKVLKLATLKALDPKREALKLGLSADFVGQLIEQFGPILAQLFLKWLARRKATMPPGAQALLDPSSLVKSFLVYILDNYWDDLGVLLRELVEKL